LPLFLHHFIFFTPSHPPISHFCFRSWLVTAAAAAVDGECFALALSDNDVDGERLVVVVVVVPATAAVDDEPAVVRDAAVDDDCW
jgi:hypothetical protein